MKRPTSTTPLMDMTAGRGPDSCIDAVGMEAHAPGLPGVYDRVKQSVMLETDRPYVLRQAILAVPQRRDGIRAGACIADGSTSFRREL